MVNTLGDQGVASVRNMPDDDLVNHAGTKDMAVLVEAILRLKKSSERLEQLTRWLMGLTAVLAFLTLALLEPVLQPVLLSIRDMF